MPTLPFVSVVVLSFNSSRLGDTFTDCLRSVLETDYPNFEVLIIDNGSSDDSARTAYLTFKANYNNLKMARLETNLGYAGGNNAALRHLDRRSSFLAFLNDDLVVGKDWLGLTIQVMLSNNEIAAAGPSGNYLTSGARAVSLSDSKLIKTPHIVAWVQGYCMVVRREPFELVAGFNPNFFMYNEDIDLCERLRCIGFQVFEVALNSINHGSAKMGATARASNRKYFLNSRNTLYLVYQSFLPSIIPVAIILAFMTSFKRCISFLRAKNFNAFSSTLSGTFSGFFGLKKSISSGHSRKPFRDNLLLPVTVDILHLVLSGKTARPLVDSIILQKASRNLV